MRIIMREHLQSRWKLRHPSALAPPHFRGSLPDIHSMRHGVIGKSHLQMQLDEGLKVVRGIRKRPLNPF